MLGAWEALHSGGRGHRAAVKGPQAATSFPAEGLELLSAVFRNAKSGTSTFRVFCSPCIFCQKNSKNLGNYQVMLESPESLSMASLASCIILRVRDSQMGCSSAEGENRGEKASLVTLDTTTNNHHHHHHVTP